MHQAVKKPRLKFQPRFLLIRTSASRSHDVKTVSAQLAPGKFGAPAQSFDRLVLAAQEGHDLTDIHWQADVCESWDVGHDDFQ